jgi:hypothetical protein
MIARLPPKAMSVSKSNIVALVARMDSIDGSGLLRYQAYMQFVIKIGFGLGAPIA